MQPVQPVQPAGAATLVQGLPHAAWLVALPSARVLAVNAAAARLLGRPVPELLGAGAEQLAFSPEDAVWWAEAGQREWGNPSQWQQGLALDSDTVLACAGDERPVRRTVTLMHPPEAAADAPSPAPAAAAWALVMVEDRAADEAREAERESRIAELEATLESTADGLLVTDLAGGVRAFNRRFAAMWGLPPELLASRDDAGIGAWMQRSVEAGTEYAQRLAALQAAPLLAATDRLTLLDGSVLERVTRPLWRSGRPQGRVWAFRDLSERLAAEERIEVLSHTDSLTGLPNRRRMAEWVDEAAQAAGHQRRSPFALLVVDLDRFRQINASFGHAVGDRVLRHVAERLAGCLRDNDRLARTGGDQFGVLLATADAQAAEATARRMLHVVGQPCVLEGATFTLTCSIGIALAPAHGRTADELARRAEAAMRAVKHAGRANVQLHQMRAEVDRRSHMMLDHAMRQALVSGRFRLAYQPQVALDSGHIVGAEALLRWRDPELGDVPPGRFIPVAEESGFIVAIGDWVLAQAVRQAALWHQRGWSVPVAVNVSALQFQQTQFVERVAGVLAVSALPPHLLELELTESILVHDADEALARLHALERLGVRMSIDDFGTGYSSLSYLKRFPIDKLKIDRSFVSGLPADETDAGIVRAILQMARALDTRCIAEGVETEQQREFLVREGCAEMQGYLYAPALDPLSFEQRLVQAGAAPAAGEPAAGCTPDAVAAACAPAVPAAPGPAGGTGARHIRLVHG
ncbi:MAG: EAL domain-containing protein [Rubrivivax sp.]|nr:EAL domain-containing protein [Rubrivivax sp.]